MFSKMYLVFIRSTIDFIVSLGSIVGTLLPRFDRVTWGEVWQTNTKRVICDDKTSRHKEKGKSFLDFFLKNFKRQI